MILDRNDELIRSYRRTVERVEAEIQSAPPPEPGAPPRTVTHIDVNKTKEIMDANSAGAFVQRLSLHQKIFLLSISRCCRNGATDVSLLDVMAKHLAFAEVRNVISTPSQDDLIAIFHSLAAMRLIVVDASAGGGVDMARVRLDVTNQQLEGWLEKDQVLADWTKF